MKLVVPKESLKLPLYLEHAGYLINNVRAIH